MHLREIKVKKGYRLIFRVNEQGDLVPLKGSQLNYLDIKPSSEPLSPINKAADLREDCWKLQANSNKTSLNSVACRCKKSKCLKYYCDCFSEGRECGK